MDRPPGESPATPPPSDAPPPAAPAQWPQVAPTAPAGPARPGRITATGIILIGLGVLVTLIGLLLVLAGALFTGLRDSPDFVAQVGTLPEGFGVVMLVIGVLVLAWGVLEVLSGIFVLSGRTWARISGMIVDILGALFALATLLPGDRGPNALGLAISLLVLGAYAFSIWALAGRSAWFVR